MFLDGLDKFFVFDRKSGHYLEYTLELSNKEPFDTFSLLRPYVKWKHSLFAM